MRITSACVPPASRYRTLCPGLFAKFCFRLCHWPPIGAMHCHGRTNCPPCDGRVLVDAYDLVHSACCIQPQVCGRWTPPTSVAMYKPITFTHLLGFTHQSRAFWNIRNHGECKSDGVLTGCLIRHSAGRCGHCHLRMLRSANSNAVDML